MKKNLKKCLTNCKKNERKEFKQKIFFNGQIYDAYSLIIDIIKRAKNKILIIDNYIDDSILEMLQKKNKDVEVVIKLVGGYELDEKYYKFPGVSYYNGFDWKDYCHQVYPDVDVNAFYV